MSDSSPSLRRGRMLSHVVGTLAELASEHDRPKRERSDEQCEVDRRARFEQGICRKPTCTRKRTKGAFCTQHYRKTEANTNRYRGNAKAGRRSISSMDADDRKIAMAAFLAGYGGLEAVAKRPELSRFERASAELEPLSQILLCIKSSFEVAKRRGVADEWIDAIRLMLADV